LLRDGAHDAVVGNAKILLIDLLRVFGILVDLCYSVKDGVHGMTMKVFKTHYLMFHTHLTVAKFAR